MLDRARAPLPQRIETAQARLIGRWVAFYEWVGREHGFSASAVAETHQYCPAHGGESGEAFRFYADLEITGGGVCNSCDSLRTANGIQLLVGWLQSTDRVSDEVEAHEHVLQWVDAFCTLYGIPEPSGPESCKRLMEWLRGYDGAQVAAAYLRNRGLAVAPENVPPSIRGRIYKRTGWKTLMCLVKVDNQPVTYHYIRLDRDANKRTDVKIPKGTSDINKERKLSGQYVDLGAASGRTLISAEGVETTLAVKQLYGLAFPAHPPPIVRAAIGRAWSSLQVPDGVDQLILAPDNDHTLPATLKAVKKLEARYPKLKVLVAPNPLVDGHDKPDWLDAYVSLGEKTCVEAFRSAVETAEKNAESGTGAPRPNLDQKSAAAPFQPSKKHPVVHLPDTSDRVLQKHLDDVFDSSDKEWFWYTKTGTPVEIDRSPQTITHVIATSWFSARMDFTNSKGECTGIPGSRVKNWFLLHSTRSRLQRGLPQLDGVASRPMLIHAPEGDEVLASPGYSRGSRYYLQLQDDDRRALEAARNTKSKWDADVMAQRTPQDLSPALVSARAQRALAAWSISWLLNDNLLADFEFSTNADRANAWAAALTPGIASAAGHTPFVLVEAPQRGSGKTTLANIMTGMWEPPSFFTWPGTEEELSKRIGTAFSSGQSLIVLDNITKRISSDTLASLVTAPEIFRIRRLGGNDSLAPPTGLTLYTTANNADIHEDIIRRSLPIRLDPRGYDPARRPSTAFQHPNIERYLKDNLVTVRECLFTALLSWSQVGCPTSPARVAFTNFDGWSGLISGWLKYLGQIRIIDDLLGNRDRFIDGGQDSAMDETESFLATWLQSMNATEWTDIESLAKMAATQDLVARVAEVSTPAVRNKVMGHYLRRLVDRSFKVGQQVWRLERSATKMRSDADSGRTSVAYQYRLTAVSEESQINGRRRYREEPKPEFDDDDRALQSLLDRAAGFSRDQWFSLVLPWILGRRDAASASPSSSSSSTLPLALPASLTPTERTETNDLERPPTAAPAGPWALPTSDLLEAIRLSPWKAIDLKATQSTPFSPPLRVPQGDARPRLRTIAVIWDHGSASFDFDTLNPEQRKAVCRACLSGTLIGHTVSFQLNWLRRFVPETMPLSVIDLVLHARLWAADSAFRLTVAAAEHTYAEQLVGGQTPSWSLPALAFVHLGQCPDRALEKPHHWVLPAPLSNAHYQVSQSDAKYVLALVRHLLRAAPDADPAKAYRDWVARQSPVTRQLAHLWERIPWQISDLHVSGLPFDTKRATEYIQRAHSEAVEASRKMLESDPELRAIEGELLVSESGLSLEAQAAIASAFERRGVKLARTNKSDQPLIGEKALRAAGATAPQSKPFYDLWVRRNRNLVRAEMADKMANCAVRGRIHGLFEPVTATVRLAASDPPTQQTPTDPDFRALVAARKGHAIISCDYSALDMRVGAALALDEQDRVMAALETPALCEQFYGSASAAVNLERWLEPLRPHLDSTRRYSALRNAFRARLDVHTWTAVSLAGLDPAGLVGPLIGEDGNRLLESALASSGGNRKFGKVTNLGLLYVMSPPGFRTYAARTWDVHFSAEEVDRIIPAWGMTYPELELLRNSAALRAKKLDPFGRRFRGRLPKISGTTDTPRHEAYTLTGRLMVAPNLSAALNYPDQATGADIINMAIDRLWSQHRQVYDCMVLQVHDELVLEAPVNEAEAYGRVVRDVMLAVANEVLAPYEVPMEAELNIGETWS